jgi:hypothetical protein
VAAVESERTRGRRRATGHGAARPVSSTGASGRLENRPVKGPMAIFICGAINTCGAGLGWCLALLGLSVHALGVLGEPLTHLCLQECESITSECDSSALHRENCIDWH